MRVTIHLPDQMGNDLRQAATVEHKSVSAFITAAVRRYIADEQRKRCGEQVLGLAGTVSGPSGVLMELERGREADDRT